MKSQGAVVEKNGITFAVVKVEKHVFEVPGRAWDTMNSLQPGFPHMSIVLVTQDSDGTPAYYGRPDIVGIMPETRLETAEWKDYELDQAGDSQD